MVTFQWHQEHSHCCATHHHPSPKMFTFLNWNSAPIKHWKSPFCLPPHPSPRRLPVYFLTLWIWLFSIPQRSEIKRVFVGTYCILECILRSTVYVLQTDCTFFFSFCAIGRFSIAICLIHSCVCIRQSQSPSSSPHFSSWCPSVCSLCWNTGSFKTPENHSHLESSCSRSTRQSSPRGFNILWWVLMVV